MIPLLLTTIWISYFILPWMVLLLRPKEGRFGTYLLLVTGIGYLLGNAAINLKWKIRRDWAAQKENLSSTEVGYVTSDGANLLFWLYAGWFPSLIYGATCYAIFTLGLKLISIRR